MNENVLAAVLRLNESIALGRIKPFHGTARHRALSPVGSSMIAAGHTESKIGAVLARRHRHKAPILFALRRDSGFVGIG